MDNWFSDPFAQSIWEVKYAGEFTDIQAYFLNLAKMVAQGDERQEREFFRIMWNKRFSPGGRILAYGGRPGARLSLMNCTTHQLTDDSLEAISDTAYTIMRASSRGQGIGINLSKLRPAGAPVNNAARTSTGAISFMEMLNTVGGTIGQEGRRAAMLFSLDVSHPDLYRPGEQTLVCPKCSGAGCLYCNDGFIPYDFLHVKKVPGKVENANISVMVTDAFMEAVVNDEPWQLRYAGSTGGVPFVDERTVPARELFLALAASAKASAEPGILYWDTSRKLSNSDLFGERWKIVGTNACSEEVLDQDGVCNLGSLNLAAYVVYPFTQGAYFDFHAFRTDVAVAIEFLDNVVDLEIWNGNYISDAQRQSLEYLRRLGLGVMGTADMLAMLGRSYSSDPQTLDLLQAVFSTLEYESYRMSILLAREKGPAKAWHNQDGLRRSIVSSGFFAGLPNSLKSNILKYGTRNITLLSLAPTGTISNFFGVSSGIEPLFAPQFVRRTRINGHDEMVDYVHPGVRLARSLGVPDSIYQTAYEVSPDDHLLVQATVQQYIDASIAKTVNMPAGTTKEQVARVYLKAWQMGLKGLAVYVDGSRDMQVLYSVKGENDDVCPECGSPVHKEEGCTSCPTCGWAKCSL